MQGEISRPYWQGVCNLEAWDLVGRLPGHPDSIPGSLRSVPGILSIWDTLCLSP